MKIIYTVSAKIETLRMDGETQFTFHGSFVVEGSAGEPLQLAMSVPFDVWDRTECGQSLEWALVEPDYLV